MINQIINQTDRALILDSLLSYGYTMDDIIFRQLNVSKVGFFSNLNTEKTIAFVSEIHSFSAS